jgi:hypothetical protein
LVLPLLSCETHAQGIRLEVAALSLLNFCWGAAYILDTYFFVVFLKLFKRELGSLFLTVRGDPDISFDRRYSKVNDARFVQVIYQ